MPAANVQASLRICAVSPEPSLLAHTSSESRGTFRQKARSLAPLNGWACAVKTCHDRMLEDTNSLDGAHMYRLRMYFQFYATGPISHACILFTSSIVILISLVDVKMLSSHGVMKKHLVDSQVVLDSAFWFIVLVLGEGRFGPYRKLYDSVSVHQVTSVSE